MPKFEFIYTGIRVRSLERSILFYTKIMGMKVTRQGKMPHGGKYVALRSPGSRQELELNWYPKSSRFYTAYKPGEEMDHFAFRCRRRGVGLRMACRERCQSCGLAQRVGRRRGLCQGPGRNLDRTIELKLAKMLSLVLSYRIPLPFHSVSFCKVAEIRQLVKRVKPFESHHFLEKDAELTAYHS